MTIHHLPLHSDGTLPATAPQPDCGEQRPMAIGPYGAPMSLFQRAWTVADVVAYTGLGATRIRQLLRADDAPPALRCGRGSLRYSPLQVLAWLHGDDWRHIGANYTPSPQQVGANNVTSPGHIGMDNGTNPDAAQVPAGPVERRVVEVRRVPVDATTGSDVSRRRVVRPADVADADRARRMRDLLDRPTPSTHARGAA